MISFVATPIGNLQDITLRALETLKRADVIFCEDTRHTIKLLSAYDIKKPLISCHKFNEREAGEKILAAWREGKEIAVVSDAGMPVVSDPGNLVCTMLKEAGAPYTVIPGPSAFVCALILSALPAGAFTFLGFLPEKKHERMKLLERYENARETLLFHVAPQDIDAYISDLYAAFGERRACLVREITKVHEESTEFMLSAGYQGERRGECVLVVEGTKEMQTPYLALSPREHILAYMRDGMDKKEALKQAARDRGVPKSALYKYTLDL